MRTLDESSQESDRIGQLRTACSQEIIARLDSSRPQQLVRAGTNFFESNIAASHAVVVLLTEGMLHYTYDNRVQCVYEEGDFIWLNQVSSINSNILKPAPLKLLSEFAVRIKLWSETEWYKILSADPVMFSLWQNYRGLEEQWLVSVLAASRKAEQMIEPQISVVEAEKTIIEQGTVDHQVYTLLNGHLKVLVDGTQVGEILPDEIFGALAALTDTPRTATVVATEDSTVVSLHRDNFVDLFQTRPATVLKMVRDMARTIVDLNRKIIQKSEKL